MKKSNRLLIALLLVCFGSFLSAQQVVTAPQLESVTYVQSANVAKTLEEAYVQSEKLLEVKELLDESRDLLSTVNSAIRQSQQVIDIVNRQALVFEQAAAMKDYFRRNKINAKDLLRFENKSNQILSLAQRNITELQNILSSGLLNMSDSDRINRLDKIEGDIGYLYSSLFVLERETKEFDFLNNLYSE